MVRGNLGAYNESTVNVSGGVIMGDLGAFASTEGIGSPNTVNVSGGVIHGNVIAANKGTLNISGGKMPTTASGKGIFVSDVNSTI